MSRVEKNRTWIEPKGFSDHSLIFLQLDKNNDMPTSPFKLNPM
jgi:hypothetical protein